MDMARVYPAIPNGLDPVQLQIGLVYIYEDTRWSIRTPSTPHLYRLEISAVPDECRAECGEEPEAE